MKNKSKEIPHFENEMEEREFWANGGGLRQRLCGRSPLVSAGGRAVSHSNQAVADLKAYGHEVLPVNPVVETIHGVKVYPHLPDITGAVDTLTMYVNASRSSPLQDEILSLKPLRVIFNPGAENPDLQVVLEQAASKSKMPAR